MNGLRIRIGNYFAVVKHPWLLDATMGIAGSRINQSGGPTPCLATLATMPGAVYGRHEEPAQPMVLHYKYWLKSGNSELSTRSFMSTASCIETAHRTRPSRSQLIPLNPRMSLAESLLEYKRMDCGGA